ncbi:MAG: FHA domain-containing protein [Pseudomonadales bacterium]|nr:FHA domain-containing protein [Pseudomonadales bacterium]
MDVPSQKALELSAFVQLCLNDKVLDEYEIRTTSISIGRGTECDIIIDNPGVSLFHAMLSFREGKLLVEDAASTNGVIADGVKITGVELKRGESVQIAGKYTLRLIDAPTRVTTETDAKSTGNDVQNETVMVSTSTLNRMGQATRPAYLTVSQPSQASWICRLDKSSVSIGRKRSCNIRVGGWFAPREAARVDRRDDGFYLVVCASNVKVNGKPVRDTLRLKEGHRIQIDSLRGVFHERSNLNH